MNEKAIINADKAYHSAELKAKAYFQFLSEQHADKSYVQALIKDFEVWKKHHVQRRSLLSTFTNKKQQDDYKFIQSLKMTGKLDSYLERSISYIFMRDMGHALDSSATQKRIRRVVERLKKQLTRKQAEQEEMFSMVKLYRMAEKNGIESTFIWVTEKLNRLTENIPEGMDGEEAQRKLIKIIAGLVMQAIEEMGDDIASSEKSTKLEQAIRLGYAYGLTYPFIDDLLDSNVLSIGEKQRYSEIIRITLTTGAVPPLGEWAEENLKSMRFIHSELKAAFELIQKNLPAGDWKAFLEQAYVFYQSQEVERVKDLNNITYTNEELYIPVILKSSVSRLIVRSIIDASEDEGIDQRIFYYGIYNQLADDFTDMADDRHGGRVTPYTYYLKHHEKRKDLINPFELYWTVIANFIHNVYDSDPGACEVILSRAINGLKRFKEKRGEQKYEQLMILLFSGVPELQQTVGNLVQHATDVEFFDKLIRDRMIRNLKQDREEKDIFMTRAKKVSEDLNLTLPISRRKENVLLNESIIEAANYSLGSTGKRLRPIITWFMAVEEYGLDKEAIQPLLKALEFMHTASLIYDDLPAQDNADFRRGNQTLHRIYNTATAELTGLYLTQQAVAEQASLESFNAKSVLQLIHYSAKVTTDMCRGQAMDLQTKGEQLTLEQLNEMCFYKTGLGFEAALIMPAILAGASEAEKQSLKQFARHAGIAFQIKDDLLDVEGNLSALGKSPLRDEKNNNATFVSVLGMEAAKKEMWEHYSFAMETLQALKHNNPFLKHVLNYFVHRGY